MRHGLGERSRDAFAARALRRRQAIWYWCRVRPVWVGRVYESPNRPDCALAPSAAPGTDQISKRTQAADLELDDIAGFEVAPALETAAVADRTGAEHIPWIQRLVTADEGDAVFEAMLHIVRTAAAAQLAIDAHRHRQTVGIGKLIASHNPRSHGIAGIEVLALRWAEAKLLIAHLLIARAEVIEYRISENMLACLLACDIHTLPPDDGGKFELVIHQLGKAWPPYGRIVPGTGASIALEVEGTLVPDRRQCVVAARSVAAIGRIRIRLRGRARAHAVLEGLQAVELEV